MLYIVSILYLLFSLHSLGSARPSPGEEPWEEAIQVGLSFGHASNASALGSRAVTIDNTNSLFYAVSMESTVMSLEVLVIA